MATLYADKMATATKAQPRAGLGLCSVTGTFSLSAALALNDVIQICNVPIGATVVDWYLSCTDLDTATSLQIKVGDLADDDRYAAAATTGQSAAFVRASATPTLSGGVNITGVPYKITGTSSDNIIAVTVSAAPGTGATSGLVIMTVFYTMDA